MSVALDPDEVTQGAEVRVSLRADRTAARMFMRIVDTASGLMVFRTMRMTTRPSRRLDVTVGTRWFAPDRKYAVQASAFRDMSTAGTAMLAVTPRNGPVPIGLLIPLLLGLRRGTAVEPAVPVPRVARQPGGARLRRIPPSAPGRMSRRSAERGPRVRDAPGRKKWVPPIEVVIPGERLPKRKRQDPWKTGSPLTRKQVERVLDREREKRKARPWMRPLPEGTVEEVMDSMRRDFERMAKKRRKYDLTRPVKHYIYRTERDARVCATCLHLGGGIWAPWEYRPAIPIHPNCRCHYERVWASPPRPREGVLIGGRALPLVAG